MNAVAPTEPSAPAAAQGQRRDASATSASLRCSARSLFAASASAGSKVAASAAWSEARLLSLGYAFEQATNFRRPSPLVPPLPGELIG